MKRMLLIAPGVLLASQVLAETLPGSGVPLQVQSPRPDTTGQAPSARLVSMSSTNAPGVRRAEASARMEGEVGTMTGSQRSFQRLAARCYATFTALPMLAAVAGVAVAGPLEDVEAAWRREDYATVLRILRPRADQGIAHAQFLMGNMYYKGLSVLQNDGEAAKRYRLAADQGHARAQHSLGLMYSIGRGVQKDRVQALMWLELAAPQNKLAAESRDLFASGMSPAERAEAKKLAREWKPRLHR